MTTTIRDATLEDRRLAITFSEYVEHEFKVGACYGEGLGYRVIFKEGNTSEIPILMPSSQVLQRDPFETNCEPHLGLVRSEYRWDAICMLGEIRTAMTYSNFIRSAYLKKQGVNV